MVGFGGGGGRATVDSRQAGGGGLVREGPIQLRKIAGEAGFFVSGGGGPIEPSGRTPPQKKGSIDRTQKSYRD